MERTRHMLATGTRVYHLSNLFKGFKIYICKDVALRKRQDLEGHSAVVVLQRRDVVVTHRQLRAGVDLVPDRRKAYGGLDYLCLCCVFSPFSWDKGRSHLLTADTVMI